MGWFGSGGKSSSSGQVSLKVKTSEQDKRKRIGKPQKWMIDEIPGMSDPLMDPLQDGLGNNQMRSNTQEMDPFDIPLPDEMDPFDIPLPDEMDPFDMELPPEVDPFDLDLPPEVDPLDIPLPQELGRQRSNTVVQPNQSSNRNNNNVGPGLAPNRDVYNVQPDLLNRDNQSQWKHPRGELFEENPTEKDVIQGDLGDCFFLSVLAAVVKQSPDYIKDMIKVDGEETFRVRLYKVGRNPRPEWIAVNHKLPMVQDMVGVDEAMYASPSENLNIWAPIIEKAYAKQSGGYEVLDQGGSPMNAMIRVLGQRPEYLKLRGNPDEVFGKVATSFEAGNPITASVPGHAIAVVGVERSKGTITLYDQASPSNHEEPYTMKQLAEDGVDYAGDRHEPITAFIGSFSSEQND